MPKTALLFPGQGSQKVGMGLDLAETFPSARAIFDEADEALGFSLSKLCFEGPEEDLKLTENTQPAILTCSMAVLAVMREEGLADADFVAGHSLGEYSALVAAGALDFADAVKLVRKRGRYMQEAVPPGEGAMAAIIGMAPEKVAEICEQAAEGQVLSPANLNAPAQVVIAGEAAAVERAVEQAKAAGAPKAVMLQVSAPFHCAMMRPAQERLAVDLDAIAFRDLTIPLVNNADARIVRSGEEARQGLKDQVPNPVRWEESIRLLAGEGVERWIEVGPSRVLTGLLRNIDRALKGEAVGDLASLEKLSS
ncbi:MAG: ACP S-malonyltransferase [Bryobacterales bacterium]|nr:ACP S-malonyltransferase [Bryobacterales bacterium]